MNWARQYIGKPYSDADCAALLNLVNREIFGRELGLPTIRPTSPFGRGRFVMQELPNWRKTDTPEDGDAVLMRGRRGMWHVGVYVYSGSEACVLHSMRNTGVAVNRVRELPTFGIKLEGFYRWLG